MEKLQRVIVSRDGELEISRSPNNEEIVTKVNEIVDWINFYQQVINNLKIDRVNKNPFKTK